MGKLANLIDDLCLKKTEAQNLRLGTDCIICGIPKDDINALTCNHPQCINTIIECVCNEGEFLKIAQENEIDNPDDLENYLKEIEQFYDFIGEESLKDVKQKMELIFQALDVENLQEMLDEIQSVIKKLETKNPD